MLSVALNHANQDRVTKAVILSLLGSDWKFLRFFIWNLLSMSKWVLLSGKISSPLVMPFRLLPIIDHYFKPLPINSFNKFLIRFQQ
jgi:hypothetical protein